MISIVDFQLSQQDAAAASPRQRPRVTGGITSFLRNERRVDLPPAGAAACGAVADVSSAATALSLNRRPDAVLSLQSESN